MNVLQIIDSFGLGGVERIVFSIDDYLKNVEVNSSVAVNKSMYTRLIEHFEIKDVSKIYVFDDSSIIKMLRDIRKIISEVNPDVVHTHARRECVCVAFWRRRFKYRHLRTQHMEEEPKIKVSIIEKYMLKRYVDFWTATSQSLVDKYLKNKRYISNEKISVVYNGVKNDKNCSNNVDMSDLKFCVVSRLTMQKGIDLLIQEITNFEEELRKNIYIDIYGEGEEFDSIFNMICQYDLQEQIKYKGLTNNPRSVVIDYYSLLMPSRYEGLPLVMLESMSTGTPVAIHDVGCVREIIKNEYNGWIIDESNTWKSFFENVFNNKYAHDEIVYNAKRTYAKNFSEMSMCEKYYHIYIGME